jgi:hypothetical protein
MRQWSPRVRLATYLKCKLIAQKIKERSWTDMAQLIVHKQTAYQDRRRRRFAANCEMLVHEEEIISINLLMN